MPKYAGTAKIILIAALLLLPGRLLCADDDGQRLLLQKELSRDVEFLADSICAGRKTGTAGSQEAAFYLIRRLSGMGYSVSVQSFRTGTDVLGRNIVAGNTQTRRPSILLMAYYDGLGRIGDKLYPGADANASGVAALLCAAGRMKDRGDVIIAFVDAHNANSAGAEALKEKLSKQSIKLVVNFDILGSTMAPPDNYWKDYLIILGGERYRERFTNLNYGVNLHLYYDYYSSRSFTDLFYRRISDHKVFLGRGVPVVMFTSGITLSTNRETDTASSLDYPVFAERMELILKWLKSIR